MCSLILQFVMLHTNKYANMAFTDRRTNEKGAKSSESKISITPKNMLVCDTTRDYRNS